MAPKPSRFRGDDGATAEHVREHTARRRSDRGPDAELARPWLTENASTLVTPTTAIVASGIVVGATGGVAVAQLVSGFIVGMQTSSIVPIVGAASLLVITAILSSVMPAAMTSRVDVVQALARSPPSAT